MFKCRCCHLSLVSFLCLCFFLGLSHAMKCVTTDRQALVKFKDGFLHGRNFLSSWKGEDCCKWEGISCNNLTGHVTSLSLPGFVYSVVQLQPPTSLRGKIDSCICELQHLTYLDLSYNRLEGKIPKCIGSLVHLIELKLADNSLVGDIPQTLGNLSNLQTLNLGYNYRLVVANDLEWLSHLANLRYLDLSDTNLSLATDWLSSIRKIPYLSELHLGNCQLTQVNPKSIPCMNSSTSLKILSLPENEIDSSTLSWVLNVSKVLTHLDLSFNSLQHFPDGLANMISLSHLRLSDNELESTIPKSFRRLCQLEELWLDSNKLSGQLNDNIGELCCAQNGLKLLDLRNNPLSSGPFPDLSCLSSLNSLSLQKTNIAGPLPEPFTHLPSLEDLDLSHNQLSGALPSTIWQLSSLRILNLASNKLNGVDKINEAHGSNLSFLDLSYNQLSGSLPLFAVTKLISLNHLDLSHNQLSGTIPYTIGQLSSLQYLLLSSNKLNGVISESHLSNLSRLENLNLAKNSLSFNMSSNWVPQFQLLILDASSCILGPKFPTWLKHQRELDYLQISDCGISDSFPKWFWNLSSGLSYLNVSNNKLSGALPKSLQSLRKTPGSTWDFSFNNLFGPLPHFPELFALYLSNNMFSGSVSSVCSMSPLHLAILDLSSNLLTGPLSNCWGKFQSLEVLNLAKNNLAGRIPKSLGTLQQIRSIHLNNNNFSGEIPSLNVCGNLKFIDFGDNNFQGTLSAWVGHNLNNLIVLRLRANKFLGNIPVSLCNLSSLQVLDLSSNNITGEIPHCLSHIIALSNMTFPRRTIYYGASSLYLDDEGGLLFDEAQLAWKGENREYGKNLGLMTAIDLSCNHLKGEIPRSITALVALAGLNLSGNNLTGFIPNNIGQMKMLESLDLSKNHLYGRMPSSFSSLTFLSYMNLSFNNLSGKIPTSTQLQSFNASQYYGNNELCGPPLTNHCPEDAISPNGSPDKNGTNEDEDELISFGFYISMGLGIFVGFWGVCGTLVIKSSWRRAYFQFFNNINDWICLTIILFAARMKKRLLVQE